MINKDQFYLQDVALCKALQPVMERKGIEPDSYWDDGSEPIIWIVNGMEDIKGYCPTWRKDSFLTGLDDWCFDIETGYVDDFEAETTYFFEVPNIEPGSELDLKINALLKKVFFARGQESLIATAELILLLEKENVG